MKDLLSEKFNMHYENAQRFCEQKNFEEARKSFLLAAEAMLMLAKESKGNLRTARLERAKSLMSIADKICPQTTNYSTTYNNKSANDIADYMTNSPKNNMPDYMNKIDFGEIFDKKTTTVEISKPEQNVNLRPKYLDDYCGQEKAKKKLHILVDAAKGRNEAVEHILIYGGPGLGKTTLAHILANEMNANFLELNATTLTDPQSMINVLKKVKEKDIVFIDEIQALSSSVNDALLTILEDFKISYLQGKGARAENISLKFPRFTCIGATTHPGTLSKPLFDRLVNKIKMEPYSIESLTEIATSTFAKLGYSIEPDAAIMIAKRGRGIPRVTNNLVKGLRDVAQLMGTDVITVNLAENYFINAGIDENGLTDEDKTILEALIKKFGGGPVSLKILASATGEGENIIENRIEPYLIYMGFIKISSSGRMATPLAYEYLEKSAKSEVE